MAAACVSPGLWAPRVRLAGLRRLWARGLAGAAKPRSLLRIPAEAETARRVAEKARGPAKVRRFIARPELARIVASRLASEPGSEGREAVVLECEPGPGILTRTLLNAGAHVIALESNNSFLSDLESLKKKLHGQLEVMHCDFFKLDPIGSGSMKPPVMYSEKLFENLGISADAWTAGVALTRGCSSKVCTIPTYLDEREEQPIFKRSSLTAGNEHITDVSLKVVGIVPQKRERNLLWKLIYALYERSSIYRYGRIELNLFISEKEYKTLVAKPEEARIYQALSVLWQTACDIQLLHMEPWSSFLTNSRKGGLSIPKSVLLQNDHLCLVRMTPRRDLFTENLTTVTSRIFIVMVKQCLVKGKTKLIDKLNLWSCESGKKLLRQLEIPENITTGSLYPEQYRCLFELMEQSHEFDQSWLYDDDCLEDNRGINI